MVDEALANRLSAQLGQVNDWLRFAETKNVGIVGLASSGITLLLVAVRFLREEGVGAGAGVALVLGGVMFSLSLLAGVWSFMPATALPNLHRKKPEPPSENDNLLFFGHVVRYQPTALAEATARRYLGQDPPEVRQLDIDLASQIIINAQITARKLDLFRWAVLLFAAGVLLSAGAMLTVLIGW